MSRFVSIVLFASLFLCGGCNAFRQLQESLKESKEGQDKIDHRLDQAGEVVQDLRNVHAEAKAAADKDGDGELDPSEYTEYLLMLGLLLKQQFDRKKDNKNLNGRIEHERAKRKVAEAEAQAALRKAAA